MNIAVALEKCLLLLLLVVNEHSCSVGEVSSQVLFAAGVGACDSASRELDDELMHNAVVTVDTRDGAMKESGDIIQSGVSCLCVHMYGVQNLQRGRRVDAVDP